MKRTDESESQYSCCGLRKKKKKRNQNYNVPAPIAKPSEAKPDFSWLNLQFHNNDEKSVKRPQDIELMLIRPPSQISDDYPLDNIQGSMIGLALGDALGAHVEFRPHEFLLENPVTKLQGGGTWGLQMGQFTDDTSTSLCLATSLIVSGDFIPYDQLIRYQWWYKHGYMSSTGQCFDIGKGTSDALVLFERRQKEFAQANNLTIKDMDTLSNSSMISKFDVNCGATDGAGNGSLMRLAPVPLFFHRDASAAVEYSGLSSLTTHGDQKAVDACRYFGALITAAVRGETKPSLLAKDFYQRHAPWFDNRPLHPVIQKIADGSFKKPDGYQDGIRGKGYVVDALEAALWAFWSDENSFEKGVLAAVNLGDDTDTTAAIYGQLAGAYYGYSKLPEKWTKYVYAKNLILCMSDWICYRGSEWTQRKNRSLGLDHPESRNPRSLSLSLSPSNGKEKRGDSSISARQRANSGKK